MKNLLFLLIAVSFISCKKEIPEAETVSEKQIDSTELTTPEIETVLQTDTLKAEKLGALNVVDKILIKTVKKEISKDSMGTAFFKLEFYNKEKLVKSFPTTIEFGSEEGEWYLSEDVFLAENSNKTDPHFIELSYGYPACGYTHTNYLFFIDEKNFQFVTKNESMSDSGFGIHTTFEPIFQNGKLISFTSKIINVDSDDSKPYNEENENIVISFSDSIVYTKSSNTWIGKLKTPKGKVFRKVTTNFQEYFK